MIPSLNSTNPCQSLFSKLALGAFFNDSVFEMSLNLTHPRCSFHGQGAHSRIELWWCHLWLKEVPQLPQSPKPQMPQWECGAAPEEPWQETIVHTSTLDCFDHQRLATWITTLPATLQQFPLQNGSTIFSSPPPYPVQPSYTLPRATELRSALGGHRWFLECFSKPSLSFWRPRRRKKNVHWEMPPPWCHPKFNWGAHHSTHDGATSCQWRKSACTSKLRWWEGGPMGDMQEPAAQTACMCLTAWKVRTCTV